ncbi:MAG: alpha-N-acetylglucosaminidase [Candidatus Symbiothrix sp.]|jgi:alpha-N-acetylglucosaminidase|nr:alpha-N-acetylglucosaminidase [Candidatus Symbiothrix sp.]
MRIKHIKIGVLILSCLLISFAGQAQNPVAELLDRIGGIGTSTRIVTEIQPSVDGTDFFTITAAGNKPKIIGNNYISVAVGIDWYLKYQAHVCLTWNQPAMDLDLVRFPIPQQSETHRTPLKDRYYLNYCTYSYSMAFWDWTRWQQEIDWMALHGITMPLALTGTEVVWRNILLDSFNYTEKEANAFIAGSGFQAWFLMNNLEGWGGPNPSHWYDQQAVLQKKILAEMREWGMKPILPGYSGMVPHNIEVRKGWEISDPGKWCGFQRPGFLLPTDPHFDEIAQVYYDEMRRLYGTSDYYSIDPFHEGGVPKGVDVGEAYQAIYKAMTTYSGNPTTPQWVLQSWNSNPKQAALDALEPGTLIVLDLFSDGVKKWGNSYQQTNGTPHKFIFCMLNNFGGRTGLHGRLPNVINDFQAAQKQFPESLVGIGATPEGIENNPVLYEALFELPWRNTPITASEWIKSYAEARYGEVNKEARQAWQLLLRSVYDCQTEQQGSSESVLCARPTLPVTHVSTWSTTAIYYDPENVKNAAQLLLSQSRVLSGKNYEYDVVDVVRQVLADEANALLKEIQATNDIRQRDTYIDRFLQIILDQDRLMNTQPNLMVGSWIRQARALGVTTAEKDLYEQNARLQITTWGPKFAANDGGLHDYSNREWGGLLKDYYYPRWKLYFDYFKKDLPAPTANEFFTMENAWANTPTTTLPYPFVSQENPIDVAKELLWRYIQN